MEIATDSPRVGEEYSVVENIMEECRSFVASRCNAMATYFVMVSAYAVASC